MESRRAHCTVINWLQERLAFYGILHSGTTTVGPASPWCNHFFTVALRCQGRRAIVQSFTHDWVGEPIESTVQRNMKDIAKYAVEVGVHHWDIQHLYAG